MIFVNKQNFWTTKVVNVSFRDNLLMDLITVMNSDRGKNLVTNLMIHC